MNAQKSLLAAATLAAGTTIDRWSRVSALAALIVLIATPSPSATTTWALGLSLLVGLSQAYHATRVSLDAKVFEQWSQAWRAGSASVDADLAAFDSAVQTIFGKAMVARTLDARIAAGKCLLQRQAFALGAQLFLFSLGIALQHWGIQP